MIDRPQRCLARTALPILAAAGVLAALTGCGDAGSGEPVGLAETEVASEEATATSGGTAAEPAGQNAAAPTTDEPVVAPEAVDVDPPADGEAPADRDQWIGYLLAAKRPVETFAEPFAAIGFFPEGIATPTDGALVVTDVDIDMNESPAREEFITYPGIDTVSLSARFATTLTLEQFEAFYDDAHSAGDGWSRSTK
ncbi:MAG: hypothetical protein AAGD35_20995 [Actinomycetota bacterium]